MSIRCEPSSRNEVVAVRVEPSVKLFGVSRQQLVANQQDITFHV